VRRWPGSSPQARPGRRRTRSGSSPEVGRTRARPGRGAGEIAGAGPGLRVAGGSSAAGRPASASNWRCRSSSRFARAASWASAWRSSARRLAGSSWSLARSSAARPFSASAAAARRAGGRAGGSGTRGRGRGPAPGADRPRSGPRRRGPRAPADAPRPTRRCRARRHRRRSGAPRSPSGWPPRPPSARRASPASSARSAWPRRACIDSACATIAASGRGDQATFGPRGGGRLSATRTRYERTSPGSRRNDSGPASPSRSRTGSPGRAGGSRRAPPRPSARRAGVGPLDRVVQLGRGDRQVVARRDPDAQDVVRARLLHRLVPRTASVGGESATTTTRRVGPARLVRPRPSWSRM
jgi:hypothetical protein